CCLLIKMALKVLSALDSAKTQYYHFKAIIIAGMGLFTDSYDLFCLAPIIRILGRVYYEDVKDPDLKNHVPAWVASTLVGMALLGTVLGQLVFGRLGDRVGRRRVYGLSLMLMVLSSIGCGLSVGTSTRYVLTTLAFFRFMLGLGIGGDYPLSATIMSEFANKRTRGRFIAAVFTMQGLGILVSSMVTMVVCAIFNRASQATEEHTPEEADLVWRIIMMIGAIPAGMTYYWRMMMPETARYTALVENDVLQAAKDMRKLLDVPMSQIAEDAVFLPDATSNNDYPLLSKQFFRRHGRDLFACASTWFLVDIVFYCSQLFQSQIYISYLPDGQNVYQDAYNVARLGAIVAVCSTIPGYFATVYFIDRVGRVKIQIMGFFFMAIGLLSIGIPYYNEHWDEKANTGFMFLYGLTFFFSNFGPNTTTFIVPAELFPARFRSTCHGISGAAGKVGAIIGSVGFLWASHNKNEGGYPKAIGMTAVLVILGGVCIVGMVITYFFTRETMGRSLEENENEDDEYAEMWVLRECCLLIKMALKVLSALDSAKTQYYHFKAIIIAGMGLFTDAYDLFCLAPIIKILGHVYYEDIKDPDLKNHVPAWVASTLVAIALLGTVFGQLLFGRLGDQVGRRRVYGLSLMLMVLSSIGCGLSVGTSTRYVLTTLAFFRFMLGLGIGGDYPLSATIMSEFANKRTRGRFIAAVFTMQGFGILVSSMVTMVVCAIFNSVSQATAEHTPEEADLVWRIIMMIGAIPAGLTYYWRMMMPETARYTALVENNVLQAAKDMEKVLDVPMSQIAEDAVFLPDATSNNDYPLLSKQFFRRHGRDLFACASTWFLVDIVFYSSQLFQSQIYKGYLPDGQNVYQDAYNVARLGAIVAVCSTIPGYFATVYFIDRVGRVKIQIMGFFFMAVGLLSIGIPYYDQDWDKKANTGFMFLYGLTLFFSNFGPNTTTFIVPAELFPARFRSTCHGISGAAGKVGAIIGAVGFLWASHNKNEGGYPKAIGMTAALVILGGVCILGMVITYFFTRETMGRSLEENENEDDEYAEMCVLRCFKDTPYMNQNEKTQEHT
ncbi:hypothetical protein RJ640_020672, partial [Escallonia rubra]